MQVQGSEGVDHQLKKLKQGMRLSGVYVVGRRVPITRKASERLCEIDEEGTFMAQCGRCYHKARMIIALQNGENEEMLGRRRQACSLHWSGRNWRQMKCAKHNQTL